jgi:hypothetical protein
VASLQPETWLSKKVSRPQVQGVTKSKLVQTLPHRAFDEAASHACSPIVSVPAAVCSALLFSVPVGLIICSLSALRRPSLALCSMGGVSYMAWDVVSSFRGLLVAASGPSNSSSVAGDVWPVLLAVLAASLLITLLTHWRHALGSIPIPAAVPIAPGGSPLLGHCIPALSNLHRQVLPCCCCPACRCCSFFVDTLSC